MKVERMPRRWSCLCRLLVSLLVIPIRHLFSVSSPFLQYSQYSHIQILGSHLGLSHHSVLAGHNVGRNFCENFVGATCPIFLWAGFGCVRFFYFRDMFWLSWINVHGVKQPHASTYPQNKESLRRLPRESGGLPCQQYDLPIRDEERVAKYVARRSKKTIKTMLSLKPETPGEAPKPETDLELGALSSGWAVGRGKDRWKTLLQIVRFWSLEISRRRWFRWSPQPRPWWQGRLRTRSNGPSPTLTVQYMAIAASSHGMHDFDWSAGEKVVSAVGSVVCLYD